MHPHGALGARVGDEAERNLPPQHVRVQVVRARDQPRRRVPTGRATKTRRFYFLPFVLLDKTREYMPRDSLSLPRGERSHGAVEVDEHGGHAERVERALTRREVLVVRNNGARTLM